MVSIDSERTDSKRLIIPILTSTVLLGGVCATGFAYGESAAHADNGDWPDLALSSAAIDVAASADVVVADPAIAVSAEVPTAISAAETGFVQRDGNTYYYGDDGAMRYGLVEVPGVGERYFDTVTGAMAESAWVVIDGRYSYCA